MLTINPQTPFNLKAGSYLCVKEHKRSIAPLSKIGSLDGLNSRMRLHKIDEALTMQSVDEFGFSSIATRGFQTG